MARKRRIKWTQNSKLEVNIIINFFNKRNGSNRYSHYLKGEIKDTLKLVAKPSQRLVIQQNIHIFVRHLLLMTTLYFIITAMN